MAKNIRVKSQVDEIPPAPDAPTGLELPPKQVLPLATAEVPKDEIKEVLEQKAEAPILPQVKNEYVHHINQIVETKDGKGIIVNYKQFVKFMCGLITNVQPNGITDGFVRFAGKRRLTQDMLGAKDQAEMDALWMQLYEEYNRK